MKKLILISLVVCGCTVIKDNKATNRVKNNPVLLEKVYEFALHQHPITPQQPIYIHGKDSVVYSHDTIPVDRVHDSIIKVACPLLDMDSLRKANVSIIREYHYITDTLIQKDTTCERKNTVLINTNNQLIGKNAQLNTDLDASKHKANVWMWIGIGLIILVLVLGFYLGRILIAIK